MVGPLTHGQLGITTFGLPADLDPGFYPVFFDGIVKTDVDFSIQRIAPVSGRPLINPLKSSAFHATGHNLYSTLLRHLGGGQGQSPRVENIVEPNLYPAQEIALCLRVFNPTHEFFIPFLYPKSKISTFFLPTRATSSNINSLKYPYAARRLDDRQQTATSSNKYSGGFNSRRLHQFLVQQRTD
jgi:hypothetical protein